MTVWYSPEFDEICICSNAWEDILRTEMLHVWNRELHRNTIFYFIGVFE